MFYITRKFHFSASHRVANPELSDEENTRLFGKCSNPNGHGHNYYLEVTVAGDVQKELGFVMDLRKLNDIVEENVVSKVDHKNLNMDVDFMMGINPTTENLAEQFWNEIESKIKYNNCKLYSVKLFETEKNVVEYRGAE